MIRNVLAILSLGLAWYLATVTPSLADNGMSPKVVNLMQTGVVYGFPIHHCSVRPYRDNRVLLVVFPDPKDSDSYIWSTDDATMAMFGPLCSTEGLANSLGIYTINRRNWLYEVSPSAIYVKSQP